MLRTHRQTVMRRPSREKPVNGRPVNLDLEESQRLLEVVDRSTQQGRQD